MKIKLQTDREGNNQKDTATKANAFALTFAFATIHRQSQQNQKRVQANAPDHRRQTMQTQPTTLRTDRRAADNKGLKEIGGLVVNCNFVQLIKFGGRLTVLCSEIPNFFKPRTLTKSPSHLVAYIPFGM